MNNVLNNNNFTVSLSEERFKAGRAIAIQSELRFILISVNMNSYVPEHNTSRLGTQDLESNPS